tara:strand:- start:69 stop:650 length:582 start_codon:yes stop_codon:yes gene_type:complete
MKTPNVFIIYLNSANSQNASTPSNLNFNIGSVLEQAPNLINFQKQAYCKIKVRYFSIKRTAAQLTTAGQSTLLINLNVPHPNSIRSTTMDANEASNVRTSSIIGVVPTKNTNSSYSNEYYDNDYVYVGNPFQGDINIQILNQNYVEYTGLDNTMPYEMLLEVCFDDNPARVNDNTGKLNTNIIDYNLNGGYNY